MTTHDMMTDLVDRLSAIRGERVTFAALATVGETAKLLRREPQTVYNISSGKKPLLKKEKWGRNTVFALAEIQRYMQFNLLHASNTHSVHSTANHAKRI